MIRGRGMPGGPYVRRNRLPAQTATLAKKPRYLELADDMRARIRDGSFGAVDQFPTESVLCAHYGVSRFTVREALRTLQNEGLIQRRRGSGTVVRPPGSGSGALRHPLSTVAEFLQYANDTEISFRRDRPVLLPRMVMEQVGKEGLGGQWSLFRGIRVRISDNTPVAIADAYVHPDLHDAADAIDLTRPQDFHSLEKVAGVDITQVRQDILAIAATKEIADVLGVRRRSPCLSIIRCYYDANGRIILVSCSHHAGDRFAYTMKIDVEH
jgi:GntR family transcriptional regulator